MILGGSAPSLRWIDAQSLQDLAHGVFALAVLAARIKDRQLREQQAKQAATRKSLIGSGDRSERVRTYNFPQGRVTDHRINLTLYKIDQIMDGALDELIGALMAEHQAELLAAMAEDLVAIQT